jgi:hypothetical protein
MGSVRSDRPTLRAVEVCGWWKRDGLTVNRCPESLWLKMALDAGPFMRLGTRGSPSWPGLDPEAGYVDADCSDQVAKTACRRGGPYVLSRLAALAVDDRRRGAGFSPGPLAHLDIKRVVDAVQRAVPIPQAEIVVRRTLRRGTVRNFVRRSGMMGAKEPSHRLAKPASHLAAEERRIRSESSIL